MPSYQTQYKLADLLKIIAEGERQIELSRQSLAEKPAFEPYAAFKRIDRSSNSYISATDLAEFLLENNISVLERDIRDLFKEYDAKRDDRISYTEFLNILLPRTDNALRQACTQRETYPVAKDQVLVYEIEYALSRVFEREIDYITRIDIVKQELAERHDFDLPSLFRTIDPDRLGALDFDLLFAFFKVNDIRPTEDEVHALLRRTDKDHDTKLSYSEFCAAVTSTGARKFSVTSPVKSVRSSRIGSPLRQSASTSTRQQRNSPSRTQPVYVTRTSDKLANGDYLDYLHASAQKSVRSRSPTLRRKLNFRTSAVLNETTSPSYRKSILKQFPENNKMSVDELSTSVRSPVRSPRYRTPTKRVASPYRSRSPVRDSFYGSRSPAQDSLYKSRSPSRSIIRENLSPMKGNEEHELASALKEQIEMDKGLENIKIDLALRRDFNLLDCFKFFDVEEKGSVSKLELKDALNELGVFPTNDELYLIMRKFDKNNDGLIKFNEFTDMLAPKERGYADILNNRTPSYTEGTKIHEIFAEHTIELLKQTLNMTIKNEASSESIRQRLNRRPLFNLWEGFKALDKDNNGFVSAYEFKDMLIDHGFFPSQKEVISLLERYDKNNDGKVSYSEFIQEITPKSPKKY